jgi:hypothetical protein
MSANNDGRNDFDFLVGSWKVHHYRLSERLKGSTSWEEFHGTCANRRLLDGTGNIDENVMERESGRVDAVGFRLFEPKSRQWRIYWAVKEGGILDVPMVGGFKNGQGEFYAHEPHEGKMIYSRFIWSNITANTAHWEQAFSEDGGTTWEINWKMDFTRVSPG